MLLFVLIMTNWAAIKPDSGYESPWSQRLLRFRVLPLIHSHEPAESDCAYSGDQEQEKREEG